jgi:heptosyltransferase-3
MRYNPPMTRADDAFDRILVICTRQIGDVLLTTPLIDAATQRWPAARIDVLGFAGTLGMLRGNPQIGELIEVPAGSGWLQSLGLIRRLWQRYDLALIAQYSDRAHLYGAVAARRRSGLILKRRATNWWKRLLLDHAVVVDENQTHAVIEKLRLLAPWAAAPGAVRVQAPPGRALPDEMARALRKRYVVLHVPTLVRYKLWPVRHQVALVRALLDAGWQVVLSGGPSSADRARTAEVAAGVGTVADGRLLDVAGRLDLNQMVTLLRGAALYIGPDTSITHLAAACDTPVVALFGPIDPRLWGPWPQGHALEQPYQSRAPVQRRAPIWLVQGDPPCVPCNGAGCDRHDDSRSECLETMSAARVFEVAQSALQESARTEGEAVRAVPRTPTAGAGAGA